MSIVTGILSVILLGLVTYWLFWPDNVMVIKNPQAVQVDKQVYQAGDRLTYTVSYCKSRVAIGTITRALVDGYRTNFDVKTNSLTPGCHTVSLNDLEIPKFVPTGTYHLEATASYVLNPLRNQNVRWQSVDFQVVNKIIH